ncbi:MAG: DUF3047 domain-containing protein [Silicimonas sp.]|nr:DUF3047 domain-containing protein [Silicimonas sp.]
MIFRVFLLLMALATSATAEPVAFDKSWREQGFLRLFTNDYALRGGRVGVVSDGTVSLIWRPVEGALRGATRASWRWQVAEGVVPTDLSAKGGDDRNLALYFVFVDEATAKSLTRNNARRVLRNPSTRALVYTWGGDHEIGAVLKSPYHPALRLKILRNAPTGSFSETVDLASDHRRIFGTAPGVLVGLALSADSDDTDGLIRASVADLTLE